jgi:O-antigen/teichoic acid export membrane protein
MKISSFAKDSLILGIGTLISGLIPVVGAVFLMKLYSPEAYGQLSVFISYYFVLSTFSTGRYEQSIILPETWQEGARLTWAAIGISFLVNVFFLLLLLILPVSLKIKIAVETLGSYQYLIPFCSFLYATSQSLFYYANRSKNYRLMSFGKMANNFSQVGFQITFALLKVTFSGLIIGRVAGRIFGVLAYLKASAAIFQAQVFNLVEIKTSITRYASFPKHLSLSYLFSSLFQQIPTLFVAAHYGAFYAGQLAIATQIIAAPNALVANAIGDVFRKEAIDQYRDNGSFSKLFKKIATVLFSVAIIPFGLLVLFADDVFAFYDQDWILAGEFVQYLAPGLFFMFLVNPLASAALVREKTKFILVWSFSMFLSFLLISIYAYYAETGIYFYLILLTSVRSLHYLVEWWYCYRFSKGE